MEFYSFFDSVVDNSGNYDRPTKAIDFDRHFKDFFTSGVFPNPSTNLQVTADGTGMTVAVQPGPAHINGKKYDIEGAPLQLVIDTADAASARIDRIVIRCDYDNRKIYTTVKKGTYTQTPVAPALQRDADAYELALADIAVAAGATAIHQADITDQRLNSSVCGVVAATVEQIDSTAFYAQLQAYFAEQKSNMTEQEQVWTADFLTWFDSTKGQLGSDAAGNLQNQINDNVIFDKAAGTVTAITLATQSLVNGYSKTFIASASNNGAATTINSIPLYKPNTTTAPVLVAGKAYTVWYSTSSSCFFLKASATGTATAAQVLAGATFSNDNDTDIPGTIPSRAAHTIIPANFDQTIGVGQYLAGTQTIQGDTNLVPTSIIPGKTIFGVGGVITAGDDLFIGTLYTRNDYASGWDYAEVTSTTPAVISKKITFNCGGTVRIIYRFGCDTASLAYLQVYKNGAPAGALNSTSSHTLVVFTQDLSVAAGDYLQVYAYSTVGSVMGQQLGAYCSLTNYSYYAATLS